MTFGPSKLSRDRPHGAHPDLVRVVERTLRITTRDFRFRKVCARVSGVADPFNDHIDEFRIAHIQRSDGWIETTWNNMSDPRCVRWFAAAGGREQEGGEPPPLASAGVVVCFMG